MPKPTTVHLYPTVQAHIPGVAAVECDVAPERAAELLAYFPPAFTTDPPDAPAEPIPPDAPAEAPEA